MRYARLLPLILLACACGDDRPTDVADVPPPYAPFDGVWEGTMGDAQIRMEVTDEYGDIAGRAWINDAVFYTLSGDHRHPDVEIGLRAMAFVGHFEGAFVDQNTVEGTISFNTGPDDSSPLQLKRVDPVEMEGTRAAP